ncbi:uncharacterized protein ASCRUDRAFT_77627 [Ascoidea rubescens DSM 1968]|uniref:RING-type domain-containing protein n=1 Tax=Ascoidea rubescens DSM 1968 TaxID=1344418 RepID=A0A1D2VB81_9ASCO|nr:hypothetical protein ASCRUDRAFT_77627 [Ascoidea rubescens DSM 1968]ODV58912.1 hypothetical protein ASCRUDRAFT_77627 [Ascoidea rubescens DSM 1968]
MMNDPLTISSLFSADVVNNQMELLPTETLSLESSSVSRVSQITSASNDYFLKNSTFVPNILTSLANAIIAQNNQNDFPLRNMNSYITYLISPYVAVCMSMAIILNRTVVFASSRNIINANRNRNPNQNHFNNHFRNRNRSEGHHVYDLFYNYIVSNPAKIALRLIACFYLLKQVRIILMTLNSYSPFFNLILPNKYFNYDPKAYKDSYYYQPAKLLQQDELGLSPKIFWPLYLTLCFSQFIETLVSVTSSVSPFNGVGLTLFEHSFAFQEAQFARRPSVEILVLTLSSLCSQLIIHILALFNLRKYKLIPTSILGFSFLVYIAKTLFTGRIIYFPSICVLSFFPQLIVSFIISISLLIYFLAILCHNFKLDELTFTSNNGTFNEFLNFDLSEDFNSALMRWGDLALTAAAKASYVKELPNVNFPKTTWLFNEKYNKNGKNYLNHYSELLQRKLIKGISPYYNQVEYPSQLLNEQVSGNAELDEFDKGLKNNSSSILKRNFDSSMKLVSYFLNLCISLVLRRKRLPKILLNKGNNVKDNTNEEYVKSSLLPDGSSKKIQNENKNTGEIPIFDFDIDYKHILGEIEFPDYDISEDFEIGNESNESNEDDFEPLEYDSEYESGNELYNNSNDSINSFQEIPLLNSGILGRRSNLSNAAYKRQSILQNRSSVVSLSPSFSQGVLQNQLQNKIKQGNNEKNILGELIDSKEFQNILAPNSIENISFQRVLMAHLNDKNKRVLTRSKFNQMDKYHMNALMELMLEKNSNLMKNSNHDHRDNRNNFSEDYYNIHEDGRLDVNCVVCQTDSREVILWPCKCFAVCESCRVSLGIRGFESCICCRKKVTGYSRIYVP